MKVDKTLKSIKSFLGCTGYYRRWINDFASIARPLTDLTKKDLNINTEWSNKHDKAVLDLKAAMMKYPVLRHPMMDRPYLI